MRNSFAVMLILSMVMSFAACSKKEEETTEKVPDAPITSEWSFTYMKIDDWDTTREQWEQGNTADPANRLPIPTFVASDKEHGVLNYNDRDRNCRITIQNDGSYALEFDGSDVVMLGQISGNKLTITYKGESKMTIEFVAITKN